MHRITFTVSPSTTEVGKLECSYVIEKLENGKDPYIVQEIQLFNEYTRRSISVEKIWAGEVEGQSSTRPASIQVQLKADGENHGNPVTLNEGNSWTYTWTDLPMYDANGEIQYTVAEITKAEDGKTDLP